MSVRFEAEDACQLEGLLHACDVDTTVVCAQDVLVKALDAHLQLRTAKAA